ncbi:MAG TPA: hypothetical protein VGG41_14920 [Solirubrobacteraceae bacterium]|jgi:hypothetical protein
MASQKAEEKEQAASKNGAPNEEAIRQRAYEISQRDDAGSAAENWQRAEAELQSEAAGSGPS